MISVVINKVAYLWLSLQIIFLESKIQHKHQQCDEM